MNLHYRLDKSPAFLSPVAFISHFSNNRLHLIGAICIWQKYAMDNTIDSCIFHTFQRTEKIGYKNKIHTNILTCRETQKAHLSIPLVRSSLRFLARLDFPALLCSLLGRGFLGVPARNRCALKWNYCD